MSYLTMWLYDFDYLWEEDGRFWNFGQEKPLGAQSFCGNSEDNVKRSVDHGSLACEVVCGHGGMARLHFKLAAKLGNASHAWNYRSKKSCGNQLRLGAVCHGWKKGWKRSQVKV